MFNQLLSLLLALLMVNFVPLTSDAPGVGTPLQAIGLAVVLLGLFCGLLKWQGRCLAERYRVLVQIEILALLAVLFFGLGIQRLYSALPLAASITVVLTIVCYGAALACYYHGSAYTWRQVYRQLQLLVPMVLPFLCFTLILDSLDMLSPALSTLIANPNDDLRMTGLLVAGSFLVIGMLLVGLPPLIVRLWDCVPLVDRHLQQRLAALCGRAHFRHGGIVVWRTMGNAPNAAIVGVMPRWRYILFSPGLLSALSPLHIEAVLAHEIGHSAHRHLLIYPFILLGMAVSGVLVATWLTPTIELLLALLGSLYPSSWWAFAPQPLLFLPFAVTIALYFRLVFGYFSRLFERQADLHGIAVGLPPAQMASALDALACAAGDIHEVPSWHHHSLGARIRFLLQADVNTPQQHQRYIWRALALYTLSLTVALTLIIAPLLPANGPWQSLMQLQDRATYALAAYITTPWRQTLAARYLNAHHLANDRPALTAAVAEGYATPAAFTSPAVAEFIAISHLLRDHQLADAASLALVLWQRCDATTAPSGLALYRAQTEAILSRLPPDHPLYLQLRNAYQSCFFHSNQH